MNSVLPPATADDALESSLLRSDPELFPLVEAFVLGLNQRLCDIDAAAGEANWKDLRSLAHQLKGAGGSYGYARISETASRIEEYARDQLAAAPASAPRIDPPRLSSLLHELAAVAGAAQRGIVDARR